MDRSKRFTLFAFPDRHVHSDTNSASPGSILAMQQLRATTKSLTFPPLSIARYSFIQLSHQGRQWREGSCPIFLTVAKGDSNTGSLDCESGILPLCYRSPFNFSNNLYICSFKGGLLTSCFLTSLCTIIILPVCHPLSSMILSLSISL